MGVTLPMLSCPRAPGKGGQGQAEDGCVSAELKVGVAGGSGGESEVVGQQEDVAFLRAFLPGRKLVKVGCLCARRTSFPRFRPPQAPL